MQAPTRVSTTTVHDLLFADDCALNTVTKEDMQTSMDLFAEGCADFGLTISTAKTVVMYQPPPSAEYEASRINVIGFNSKMRKWRRLDDTPLRSRDLNRLLETSQKSESPPSQLPPQTTEAVMVTQDPGHQSPKVERSTQHPHHAEASATAMEWAPASHKHRGSTPPMPKPCQRAHAVNAHAAYESAWSDIFKINGTTIPQHQPLPDLPQTPRRGPPQPLITTSSVPRRP
ncbi:unnamed protein product [Schistocephalus solidus]|uniref:Reverse transcriptase domain-containing protein n=1 Tax=Schistocephalus solidus TaxID=70667 RepID=A0A183SMC6_SCHSO|nr:unnamed protein product [Schistocephalus solidus]